MMFAEKLTLPALGLLLYSLSSAAKVQRINLPQLQKRISNPDMVNNTENTNPAKIKYVENAVNALIAGKHPEVNTTKAIGCSIKWKKSV
jgi:hypothetical protein